MTIKDVVRQAAKDAEHAWVETDEHIYSHQRDYVADAVAVKVLEQVGYEIRTAGEYQCVPLVTKMRAEFSPATVAEPAAPPIDKRATGLYGKFTVTRTDGKSAPGQKHDGCEYFVLDVTHDTHAHAALKAYAASCEAAYPLLAHDVAVLATSQVLSGLIQPAAPVAPLHRESCHVGRDAEM